MCRGRGLLHSLGHFLSHGPRLLTLLKLLGQAFNLILAQAFLLKLLLELFEIGLAQSLEHPVDVFLCNPRLFKPLGQFLIRRKLLDLLGVGPDERDFGMLGGTQRVAAGRTLPPPQPVFPRYVEPEAAAAS